MDLSARITQPEQCDTFPDPGTKFSRRTLSTSRESLRLCTPKTGDRKRTLHSERVHVMEQLGGYLGRGAVCLSASAKPNCLYPCRPTNLIHGLVTSLHQVFTGSTGVCRGYSVVSTARWRRYLESALVPFQRIKKSSATGGDSRKCFVLWCCDFSATLHKRMGMGIASGR